MGRWRKARADRRRWAAAQTLPELAQLMALWLEGELSMWPGYGDGADEETTLMIPTLAAVNRAGFLTDQSQPGYDGPGFDGLVWQQRAAVSGLVGDEQLLTRIRRAGEAAGLLVLISHPRLLSQGRGVTCTIRGGQPYTTFGEYMPPRILRQVWRGISRQASVAIADAWQVCLIDPEIGRNDRLWPLLDDLFATQTTV
ncbi:DUF6919 domain-containing protein [Streptomyces coeruleorubidus]|uniref:DUF6919 domain-containing protein n=1 Tax=Streptomyces coeruleorubidus TaxID=116188 RepID=UPI0038272E37